MKTLKAFWHWVDNDKPTLITREHLSKVAITALCIAESNVAARAFGAGSGFAAWTGIWELCSSDDGTAPERSRPEFFRPELVHAVRDLSLAICPALEAMEAAVRQAKPKPIEFMREYLADWVPRPMNFTGRMLWRDYMSPPPVLLHPDHYAKLAADLGEPRDAYEELAQALVAIDQGIAEQQRRDRTTRMQLEANFNSVLSAQRCPMLRSDDLPDDEREHTFSPEVRALQHRRTDRGSELTLTPDWVRYADWNTLRGYAPQHIVMKGSAQGWAALGALFKSFQDRILDVLVAGGAELHFE